MLKRLLLSIFLLLWMATLCAYKCPCTDSTREISLGPEVYHLKRMKKGGASQTGTLVGIYGSFQRVKPYGFYWNLLGSYAEGRIRGATAFGNPLVSNFSDRELELRLGYSIQDNHYFRSLFTPFIGSGYLQQVNEFIPPTALAFRFTDHVTYLSFGFISEVKLPQKWSVGLNVIMKWMLEGTCNVTNDPKSDDSELIMENEMQYLIELPISYKLSEHKKVFTLSCVPFFQYRHYGGRENYPYDFIATTFRLYGVRLLCNYWF